METFVKDRPGAGATILHIRPDTAPTLPVQEDAIPADEPSAAVEDCADPEILLARLLEQVADTEIGPVAALSGYILSDDPAYLPEDSSARTLARRLGRDRMLALLIDSFTRTHTTSEE